MSMQMAVSRGNYRGDPGIWGFVKGAFKTGVSLVTGGPLAAAETALTQIRGPRPMPPLPTGAPGVGRLAVMPREMSLAQIPLPVQKVPGIPGAIQRFIPGGATGFQVTAPGAVNGKAPGGYHWNKTSYFTKSEGWIEEGTKLVKNRRRNPGNMKAASRAMARMTASKLAMKMLNRVTIRKPECPTK